jgi:hypothetical protein
MSAVDGVGREGRQADGHVVGAIGFRGAVAHPLARTSVHGLPGGHLECSVFVFNVEHAVQDEGELIEVGALTWFRPARWALHPSDAQPGLAGAGAAYEFVDPFRRLARRGDPSRGVDEFGHHPDAATMHDDVWG